MNYDVAIIGAGPGGIFAAYELLNKSQNKKTLKIAVLEKGRALADRKCPISEGKSERCVNCKPCSIMSGFGGAGAFSDGKYNITNDFGGTLWEKIGKDKAINLMNYVDKINLSFIQDNPDVKVPALFSSAASKYKKICLQNKLHLMEADIRHLGTDINYIILAEMYKQLCQQGVDFYFNTEVLDIEIKNQIYTLHTNKKDESSIFTTEKCIISVGRSGSHWLGSICQKLNIKTISNRVDLGVRVEIPAEVFSHITDELYESKIVYRTEKYEDYVRTFCMNPNGIVVAENTNGIITVNGHSFEDPKKKTQNTNFALLVSQHFTEPFKDSNNYGESIAKLSNMLGGGVIVQRFGDLERGRRSYHSRIKESLLQPTLAAEPGDLSLVLPKRILDGIIEMIHALDKIAPGVANDDTLLYGVEVKFYNMEVDVDHNLEIPAYKNLYIIGDGSGVTHSLSQAAAAGVFVAQRILAE